MARQELEAATARDTAMRARLIEYRARKREVAREKARAKVTEMYIDATYYHQQYYSEGCAR